MTQGIVACEAIRLLRAILIDSCPTMEAANDTAQSPADVPNRQRWAVGLALAANGWATTLPLVTLGILLPGIVATFGLSNTQAGWLGGITTAGSLLITLPSALLLGRANAYVLTAVSVGFGALCTFLHGAAGSFAVLLLARFGFSISFALRAPSQALVISRWFALKEVPLIQGIIFAMLGIAEFIVLNVTPRLLEATGSWRAVYYVYGVVGLGITGLWLLVGGGGKGAPPVNMQPAGSIAIKMIFRHRQVWLIAIGTFLSGLSWWAYLTFWPTFMLKTYGTPLSETGLLFGILSLATVPASLAFGYLGAKIRARRLVLSLTAVAIGVAGVGMLLTGEFWLQVIFCIMMGAAWGYVPLAFSIPYEIKGIQPQEIALSAAVINSLLMSGGIVGPALVGVLADATGSLFAALMVVAVIPFTMVLAVQGIKDPVRP